MNQIYLLRPNSSYELSNNFSWYVTKLKYIVHSVIEARGAV